MSSSHFGPEREVRISIENVKEAVELDSLVDYLSTHMKSGRHMPAGRLIGITITPENDCAVIKSTSNAPKKYYKYLTKRFIHKANVQEFVYVKATQDGFVLRYRPSGEEEEAEE